MADEGSVPSEELERTIGKAASKLFPAAAVLAAVVVGILYGPGPALLVLASAGMLSAVLFLWSSLRNLAGDAPIDPLFDEAVVRAKATEVAERKRIVLRALKDLETERDVGKIDDEDYERLATEYRAKAKAILREMDDEIEPLRDKAEQIARAHLQKKGIVAATYREATPPDDGDEGVEARAKCSKCGVSNDADADFCKKCGAKLSP
jgi:hypothetical protein